MVEDTVLWIVSIIIGGGAVIWAGRKLFSSPLPASDYPAFYPPAPPSPAAQRFFVGPFDELIFKTAQRWSISPVILKAIVAKESSFNPDAINPETSYTLAGKTYSGGDSAGRRELVSWIKAGNDPRGIGVNPSMGLAQVRLSTARGLGYGGAASGLFAPDLNLDLSAKFLAELQRKGYTLETIDVYNVGETRFPGVRNLSYRDAVSKFASQFQGDF